MLAHKRGYNAQFPAILSMQLESLATKLSLDRSQLIREAVAHYLKKLAGECDGCAFSEDPGRCTCEEVRETNVRRGAPCTSL